MCCRVGWARVRSAPASENEGGVRTSSLKVGRRYQSRVEGHALQRDTKKLMLNNGFRMVGRMVMRKTLGERVPACHGTQGPCGITAIGWPQQAPRRHPHVQLARRKIPRLKLHILLHHPCRAPSALAAGTACARICCCAHVDAAPPGQGPHTDPSRHRGDTMSPSAHPLNACEHIHRTHLHDECAA